MDFFEHQERARRNTFLLVIYFAMAVVGVILAVYVAAIGILALTQMRGEVPIKLWIPELFVVATGATLLVEHVHELVDDLDIRLAEDVRDPLGAVAVIYALLLAPRSSQFRLAQAELLKRVADQRVLSELNRVYSSVEALAAEQRLPVACLALPSLHQMSPPQLLEFQNVVKGLIYVDEQISLFEFAVQRFIGKRLLPRLQGAQTKLIRAKRMVESREAFEIVLSTLANYGSPNNPQAAFTAGTQILPGAIKHLRLLPTNQCTIQRLDQALDSLESASPAAKKTMLSSFSACVAVDHKMSVEEAEIFRVIADALGCPVPPVL